ncbi:MAG: thioesterase family protein [Bacteroidia bacterium]|nr:thioesterase family protein [Bacteroidia bacterium]
MLEHSTNIRVRYADTDMMGVVYHTNYAIYFEVARTEMFREYQLPYAEMEKNGIRLPVVDLHCRYIKPALYDDLLTVTAKIKQMPGVRIVFEYTIENQRGELLCTGETTLVFTDINTGRPVRAPQYVEEVLQRYFE